MLGVLGLDPLAEPWAGRAGRQAGDDLRPVVDALVGVALEQRQAARQRKDYAAADAIRDQLQDGGRAGRGHPARPALGAEAMSGRSAAGPAGAGGRTKSGKPRPGTGGYGKRKLEGKGPTPPAAMRPGHPAQRRACRPGQGGQASRRPGRARRRAARPPDVGAPATAAAARG